MQEALEAAQKRFSSILCLAVEGTEFMPPAQLLAAIRKEATGGYIASKMALAAARSRKEKGDDETEKAQSVRLDVSGPDTDGRESKND